MREEFTHTQLKQEKKIQIFLHVNSIHWQIDINEDPVTGVAAGALGCYIRKYKLSPKTKFIVEQGFNLNMAGKMFVDVSESVKVGGYCITYGEKVLEV